jgi:hypothetical protein
MIDKVLLFLRHFHKLIKDLLGLFITKRISWHYFFARGFVVGFGTGIADTSFFARGLRGFFSSTGAGSGAAAGGVLVGNGHALVASTLSACSCVIGAGSAGGVYFAISNG